MSFIIPALASLGSSSPALVGMMQLGGAALGAYGQYQTSKAAKTAYGVQAHVAQNNAQIAEWQAQDALVRGEHAASTARMQSRQLKGRQRAGLAASGVDLGTGSALNILTDTDVFGELDAGTIRDNAAREAWAFRNQSANFTSESALLGVRGAAESPVLASLPSLLSSAGRVADRWYEKDKG